MDPYIRALMQDGLDNVLAHFDEDESQTMDGMLFVKFIIKTVKLNEVAQKVCMLKSYVAVFNGMLSIALKTPKLSYLRKNKSVCFFLSFSENWPASQGDNLMSSDDESDLLSAARRADQHGGNPLFRKKNRKN